MIVLSLTLIPMTVTAKTKYFWCKNTLKIVVWTFVVLFISNKLIFTFLFQDRCEKSLAQLLNEKDNTGCSPLHYASREGHIRSLENLIRLGACINLKNNNNESPLHFAAR